MTDYQIVQLASPDGDRFIPIENNDTGLIIGVSEGDRVRGFVEDTHTGAINEIDPGSSLEITPSGINDDGVVVGHAWVAGYNGGEGFIYAPATGFETTAAIAQSTLSGINDSGLAIGTYLDQNFNNQGIVDDTRTGTITELKFPGATATELDALNQAGDIAGTYYDASGTYHGFVAHPDGTFASIDVPGASSTSVSSINDEGQIAGTFDEDNADHLYVEDLATHAIQTFDLPDADYVGITNINDDGLVLGDFQTYTSGDQGFIYDTKTASLSMFDVPGATSTNPSHMNDQGQIIGTFDDASGEHAFVATPIAEPPCYCPGTMIETDTGSRLVEQLAIGDMLLTASGRYRPIKWVGYTKWTGPRTGQDLDLLPVCIKADALGPGVPRRDLWVSPGHAMLVDGALVHARLLINGVSIVQPPRTGSVTYFHVELDDHDIIVAEGARAESFLDNGCRRLFSNVADFRRRYPGVGPGVPCRPLLEEGFALQAIRRRIDRRAGLTAAGGRDIGPLRGFVDAVAPTAIRGWAQHEGRPEESVSLDVLADGIRVLHLVANRRRGDLVKAGLGSGRHAFEARLPDAIKGRVEVCRSSDRAPLALTAAARLQAAALAKAGGVPTSF